MVPPTADFSAYPSATSMAAAAAPGAPSAAQLKAQAAQKLQQQQQQPRTNGNATVTSKTWDSYLPIKDECQPLEDYEGNYRFANIHESYISRAMTSRYFEDMMKSATSDVIVVGGGSAGLSCAYTLAKSRPELQITIVEAGIAPGGGAWVGGQLFSAMCVRKPAHKFLDEIGVPYEDEGAYVVIKHAALFTSTILSKLLALPNVKLYNGVCAEDLIVKKDANGVQRVTGIVSNWTLVSMAHGLQSCMDPQTMSAPVVISATGHDGPFGASSVKRLNATGLLKMGEMAPLDQSRSEDLIVRNTSQIFPGLICTGMELSEAKSVPRMGASFGGMFASGIQAAKIGAELYDRLEVVEHEVMGERA